MPVIVRRTTRSAPTARAKERVVALPVLTPRPVGGGPTARHSRIGLWRGAVLTLVTLLMVAHVLHWWFNGRSLARFVMSESTRTIEAGEINPGFLLFTGSLLVTAVFGRFMCGWMCHMGALQDLSAWLLRRFGVRPRVFRSRLLSYVPIGLALYLFVWPTLLRTTVVPLLGWAGLVSADPAARAGFPGFSLDLHTERMWDGLPALASAIPFLLVCGCATVFFLGARGLCRYGCPYGGFLLPAARLAPIRVKADLTRCDQCGLCTSICTAGVRVHDQVRELGSVADHNCIRSLDCVTACPQRALSLGLAPRTAPGAGTAPRYDLTLPEELACVGAFMAVFLLTRGLYNLIPMLMAGTLGVLAAFITWKTLRLFRDQNVRLGPWQLRLHGRLRPPAAALLSLSALCAMGVVHTGIVRAVLLLAERQDDKVRVSFDAAVAGGVPPEDSRAARSARDLYTLARPLWRGGIALADTPEAGFRLAWMLLVCGDSDGALDLLTSMSHDDSTRDTAAFQAARLLLALSRPGDAERVLQAAVDADPRAFASRDLLANLWLGTGRHERAESLYRAILARRPGDTQARAGLGRAAFAAGRHDEAVATLRDAARSTPENPDIRRDYALALCATGKPREAAFELESAARARPARAPELRALAQQIRDQSR